ncbi:SpaH/EbpB family LPXTG-anchored major pilin [Pseudoflavonifractor capillosus]|uniref:SpaH/EbpB family LPXTG-anchored major pilin n=1 Tax=Pseudoflavonifractor capillosus TaxID=106588 RepID=UPI0019567E31|nr:SpaH/EbpB family LPXTG-anchored major pilin [Pseudoflavonifractor capillosus]MBM6693687.1 SpaH/EbpB family LPXTG-anchored major pilin [Pseudoflavonifractor capillosus]
MKTMKSTVARLFALCLTVAMVLSMATMGAFAKPIASTNETGAVTIIGSANDVGATVNLYKIINVNMVNANGSIQPKNPVYTWEEAVGKWVAMLYPQYAKVIEHKTETEEGTTTTYTYEVTKAFSEANAAILGAFYQDLRDSGKLGTAAKTVKLESTSATISDVAMGQYLVIATNGEKTYNPATATLYPVWNDSSKSWELNDATVVLKSKGGIEKNVDGTGDLDYSIGDTVTYRLDVAIPVYPEAGPNEIIYTDFKVGDSMGKGLDFAGIGTVKVYANTSPNTYAEGDLVPNDKNANYTVTAQGNGFEIVFNYDAVKTAVSAWTYVHVVYTATLNEDAFTTDVLGNKAYVGVNTNPYDKGSYEKTEVEKEVYTYGFTVTKVGENDEPLPGAEFKLYSDAACTNEIKFVDKGNGVYTKATEEQIKEGSGIATALVTNANGQFQVQGLACGTYYLKETKAPDGYVLPANPIKVELVDNEPDGKLDGCSVEGGIVPSEVSPLAVGEPGEEIQTGDNIFEFVVKNEKPGFNLPTTGGMGTVLFTAGGLVIMACGAALVLVTLKKKKAED